ncbi:MAG: hypothetical protein PHF86_10990 [Candidatus Nanoarchaeia archaeon]|jgi:hypothetical protein|nr:hypothetical protein [Candidatus Nanoarchaeia archaeon]
MNKFTELTVMPDFCCSGIWTNNINSTVEFEDLCLPDELIKEFEEWINFYDYKCHEHDCFTFTDDQNEIKKLNDKGKELAKKLKMLFSDIQIFYKGETSDKMLDKEEITL